MAALQYKTQLHTFGPGETIRAVVRKLNHQAMTGKMLDKLLETFNQLNEDRVPKAGESFEIPIFVGFLGSGDNDDMNKAQ